jgi:hypothetical protein
MPDNLNPEFFTESKTNHDVSNESSVNSIQVFERWLKSSIQVSQQEDFELIFEPFHKICSLTADDTPFSGNTAKRFLPVKIN